MDSRNNVVFIETLPNLLPAARQLSPQQDLESPSFGFSDDNCYSHDDMLPDMQNYASALDFGVDMLAGTVELLLPQQALPGVTLPGGASPAGISPERVTPDGSSPPPAPAPTRRRLPCLHQDQLLHLLLRHQRHLTDTPIAVSREPRPPLRAAKRQSFCLCLSLHRTGRGATTTEQHWWSFLMQNWDRRTIRRTSHTRRKKQL